MGRGHGARHLLLLGPVLQFEGRAHGARFGKDGRRPARARETAWGRAAVAGLPSSFRPIMTANERLSPDWRK